jgi:hypothetical protein
VGAAADGGNGGAVDGGERRRARGQPDGVEFVAARLLLMNCSWVCGSWLEPGKKMGYLYPRHL